MPKDKKFIKYYTRTGKRLTILLVDEFLIDEFLKHY